MNNGKKILIVNGSVGGRKGNTAVALKQLSEHLSKRCKVQTVHLAETSFLLPFTSTILNLGRHKLEEFDGFVFGTGTYWDSWGSPLQRFFENATEFEGTEIFLGKPAAVVVTMHNVGGKGILSRLQGVLNTFGLYVPPMCGMVYSTVNQTILQQSKDSEFIEDVWSLEDLEIISHNLTEACFNSNQWKSWSVDRKPASRKWIQI